ncbi:MAG: sigma-70 family RNA polymerase sigma factor [Chloroflexota bacterium]
MRTSPTAGDHAADPAAEEARIVAAARDGDVDAFNLLVTTYQTLVFNVCVRTLGSADDAADASQDAFINAFRALREFRGGSFKAWLLRIAVNGCYDILRRRQRRPSRSLEELAEQAEGEFEPRDPKSGPDGLALDAETAAAIQDGLARLPEEQRMLVLLCDVQGLNYEEAADTLQIALGTVKSRLSRARARLRDFLSSQGELPGDPRRLNQQPQ